MNPLAWKNKEIVSFLKENYFLWDLSYLSFSLINLPILISNFNQIRENNIHNIILRKNKALFTI